MNEAFPELPPQAILTKMATGFIVSQAISVASKLNIADHLKDGAKKPKNWQS